MDAKIIIAGAGLAGVLTAWHLACDHEVLLLDASEPGSGASGVPTGLVNPMMALRARPVWKYEEALSDLRRWIQEADLADCITVNQVFRPAHDEEQAHFFQESAQSHPDKCTWLQPERTSDQFPILHAPLGGLAVTDGFSMNLRSAIDQTLDAFQVRGGRLLTGTRLLGWEESENEVKVRIDPSNATAQVPDVLSGSRLILALGAGITQFDALRGLNLHCIKGEVITLHVRKPLEIPVLASKGYLVPEGRKVFVGSTYVHHFEDLHPDPVRVHELHQKAIQMIPSLSEAAIESAWAGVRVTVPKIRLPMVGLLPGSHRVTIFTGLGAKGLLMAPMLARRLAAGTPITGARVE